MENDVQKLVNILPSEFQELVTDQEELIEIVLDYGRPFELRYRDRFVTFEQTRIEKQDLEHVSDQVNEFGPDERAGIDGTLHRVSRIVSRNGSTVGLTCRVGKAVDGTEALIEDLLGQGKSILVIGAPGAGKTTLLRSCSRMLAEDLRVIVVDTSDEIAGAGVIPHPAVGRARKMSVPFHKSQHEVMIQAVENHWPQVLIIDEISDQKEVDTVRTIGTRGIQLLATVHGRELQDLMDNPTLNYLLGGIKTITLGDEEAKLRGTNKTVLERQYEPTFDVVVELVDFDTVRVYTDVRAVVDAKLNGGNIKPEERRVLDGRMRVTVPAKFIPRASSHYVAPYENKPKYRKK